MKIEYENILKSVLLGSSTKEAAEKIISDLEKNDSRFSGTDEYGDYSFPIIYHIENFDSDCGQGEFKHRLAEYLKFVLSESQDQIKWKSRRRVNREEGGDILQIYYGHDPEEARWNFEFKCDPDDETDRILKRELNRIAKAAINLS